MAAVDDNRYGPAEFGTPQDQTANNQKADDESIVARVAKICKINEKDLNACSLESQKWQLINTKLAQRPYDVNNKEEVYIYNQIATAMGINTKEEDFIEEVLSSVDDMATEPKPAWENSQMVAEKTNNVAKNNETFASVMSASAKDG